ncbi:MAG: hypothetical protein RR374_00970 [Clostridia bacterium]
MNNKVLKTKTDINLLKSSGATKSMKLNASKSLVSILLIVAIIGAMGYLVISQYTQKVKLEKQIASIQASLDDPAREAVLLEFQKNATILNGLKVKNADSVKVKETLAVISNNRIPNDIYATVVQYLSEGMTVDTVKITIYVQQVTAEGGSKSVFVSKVQIFGSCKASTSTLRSEKFQNYIKALQTSTALQNVDEGWKGTKLGEDGMFEVACELKAKDLKTEEVAK